MTAILEALAKSELTPSEALDAAKLVDISGRAVETAELTDRIERLGQMAGQ